MKYSAVLMTWLLCVGCVRGSSYGGLYRKHHRYDRNSSDDFERIPIIDPAAAHMEPLTVTRENFPEL